MITSKSKIKTAARNSGLYVAGDYLIAKRTIDILSGLAIDRTPSFTYIHTFIVPTYDNLFLHLTLGERVAICEEDKNCLRVAQDVYRQSISDVSSAKDLVDYVNRRSIVGEYSYWLKLISFVRMGEFYSAEEALDVILSVPLTNYTREKVKNLNTIKITEGWRSVQFMLSKWSGSNNELLPNIPSDMLFK